MKKQREEKALIKECQKGSREAMEELIRQYYPYVSGFLLKTTEDRELAEDLTQDTFLKMIRNIEKFDPGGTAGFGTWLITIARNGYIDHLRKNHVEIVDIDRVIAPIPKETQCGQRTGRPGPGSSSGKEAAARLTDGHDVSQEVETKVQFEEVLQLMESLPPEQAIPIRMKYVEDMTLQEIAEKFGVPPKTIKSRIHDGTVKLRKMLRG